MLDLEVKHLAYGAIELTPSVKMRKGKLLYMSEIHNASTVIATCNASTVMSKSNIIISYLVKK